MLLLGPVQRLNVKVEILLNEGYAPLSIHSTGTETVPPLGLNVALELGETIFTSPSTNETKNTKAHMMEFLCKRIIYNMSQLLIL